MDNQQYDEAVDISSSESVDEADAAPPPKPPQVTAGDRSRLFPNNSADAFLNLLQVAKMGSSGSGGGSTSGSGGGSARDGGGGGGGGGSAQQGAQRANIGSGEEDEGNSDTSSDDDEEEDGVQAAQGYNPADYANLQVMSYLSDWRYRSGGPGEEEHATSLCLCVSLLSRGVASSPAVGSRDMHEHV